MGVSVQLHAPYSLPGTHCAEGYVGTKAGLDRCRKSRFSTGFDPQTVRPVAQSLY